MKLAGWRATAASVLAGALAGLAMPPLYWLPLCRHRGVRLVVADRARAACGVHARLAWGNRPFRRGRTGSSKPFRAAADYALLGPPIVAGLPW